LPSSEIGNLNLALLWVSTSTDHLPQNFRRVERPLRARLYRHWNVITVTPTLDVGLYMGVEKDQPLAMVFVVA
jgi:hypothetical protein